MQGRFAPSFFDVQNSFTKKWGILHFFDRGKSGVNAVFMGYSGTMHSVTLKDEVHICKNITERMVVDRHRGNA